MDISKRSVFFIYLGFLKASLREGLKKVDLSYIFVVPFSFPKVYFLRFLRTSKVFFGISVYVVGGTIKQSKFNPTRTCDIKAKEINFCICIKIVLQFCNKTVFSRYLKRSNFIIRIEQNRIYLLMQYIQITFYIKQYIINCIARSK